MKKEFGRTLSNLRKKKGLSQKDAAAKLGISQALLSHYEKGIRECGLEFVVRAADYYEVSADYLLGRSSDMTQNAVLAEESESPSENNDVKIVKSNAYCLINRRILNNTTSISFSMLSKMNNKKLQKYISEYLSIGEYKAFRRIYSINEKNNNELFRLDSSDYESYCDAALRVLEARINDIASNIEGLELSLDALADEYYESFPSLNELIKNAERAVNQNIKI